MSAIADVARLAGVSKATASRALSGRGYVADDTRLRVQGAASELGYIASPNAASLVTGRTKNIGVIIPFVNRWFFGEVLEGIERELLAAGYDLTLYNVTSEVAQRSQIFEFFLARKRVDAVIAVGVELSVDEVERLQRTGKPVVGIGGPIPHANTIAIDDVAASRLATEHLLSLGHTRIAHIGGNQAQQMDFSVHGKRLRGFELAMEAAGLPTTDSFWPTELSMPGGYAVALQVLGDPRHRPTAIFAACDEVAFGTILAAQRLGVEVPRDLSITGIDDHEYAAMFGLTTVVQAPREQGRLAVASVLRLLETDAAEQGGGETILPSRLVVRSSTTAAAPVPVPVPVGGR
ncbi:LacI family DNA-binding transcriptional regulator [Leifsonia flava]|uniref:LacI family transcriptional regulator n=1 Tax=Orlajensenia leifsoniae TaxID=2561933 RepID=A0A4Y9QW95_9MICO|nr:LacI family DNA-binding transcriptional regulator [Leifsonia flava]TFV96729.1 LacI family transcriptional regulator [Leifsonia flava]